MYLNLYINILYFRQALMQNFSNLLKECGVHRHYEKEDLKEDTEFANKK